MEWKVCKVVVCLPIDEKARMLVKWGQHQISRTTKNE